MAAMVSKMVPLVPKEGVIRLFKSSDPLQFADGGQCRDFIYVKDAVRMTCAFLSNTLGGIYNIGSGEVTTWNQLAKAVFKALDKCEQIEYIDMPVELAGQYQNYTRADMRKYCSAYQTETPCLFSIDEGVSDYIRNHLLEEKRW
jgi:ADP-L-glycero-D-manno-heptose 6-epimerase